MDNLSDLPLALSMGEPGGVGFETALFAWRILRAAGPAFFLIGDVKLLRSRARRIGYNLAIEEVASAAEAITVFPSAFPVLALDEAKALQILPAR